MSTFPTSAEWREAAETTGELPGGAGLFSQPTIARIFDEVAAMHSGRVALTFEGRQLTYGELQQEAEHLAMRLRSAGVGPETLVGVFLDRTPLAIVALLGILKAGGAYLPLDPVYPSERIALILSDAQPAVVLVELKLRDKLPPHNSVAICLDDPSQPEEFAVSRVDGKGDTGSEAGAENLAYVIYTSGSTGKPKGVMVTHANVVRLLSSTGPWFGFNERDVWTLFHSLAFDFSVWEVWGCLLFGGRLVIVPFAVSRSPEDFHRLLAAERVTVLNQTPSAFYQLIQADLTRPADELALRVIVFGGEALNFRALRPWFARHGDREPRLINMYGITETTVHVTYRVISSSDAESGERSLIGAPIPDLRLYLLGDDRRPVAAGEVGEIFVGGAGVARGYLNRPELTAERFLDDPFSPATGTRMYKSGDLARRLEDGEVEYLGRGDMQVKIQGFRIELGEVEAAVTGHPSVQEARVFAHTDPAGNKRLAAYFIARPGTEPSARELSEFLAGKLPPWMLPSVYLTIAAFPLTANGKVDPASLPQPVFGSVKPNDVSQPASSSLEQQVAGVWREVLAAEHIGLDDNFFDIGGTSLLLVAVHGRLQALLTRKIPITDLFGYTTVRTLSEKLEAGDGPEVREAAQDAVHRQAEKQRLAFARARSARKNPVPAEGGRP